MTMASNMNSDVKMNGLLKIFGVNSDGHMEMNREALKFISNENESRISKESQKFVIISVVGPCRKGKLFLLNFLLGYLRNKVSVTTIDQQNKSNAMGNFKTCEYLESAENTSSIKMWPEIFHIDGVSVILMDTQCKIDMEHNTKETTKLLKISSMLSTFQIICFHDEIDEEDMLQNIEKKLNYQIKDLQEKIDSPFSNEDHFNFQMMMVENMNPSEENYRRHSQLDYVQKFKGLYEDLFNEKHHKTSEHHFVHEKIKYFPDITETISNMFKKIGTQNIFNDFISLISMQSRLEGMLEICSREFNYFIFILKAEITKFLDVVQRKKNEDQHVSELPNKSDQRAFNSWVEDPSSEAAASSANVHGADDLFDSSRFCEKRTKFQHRETTSLGQESHDDSLGPSYDEEDNMIEEEYIIISNNGEILSTEEFMASQHLNSLDIATNDVEMTIEENENDPNFYNTLVPNSKVESIDDDLQTDTNTTIETTNYPELQEMQVITEDYETAYDFEILQEVTRELNDDGSSLIEAAGNENDTENATLSENHMEVDENTGKWTQEIYRIISFSDMIEINTIFEFASVGFYWLRDNIARCTYCQSEQEIISGATSAHDRQHCPLFNQENNVQNIKVLGIQQNMSCESHRILTFLSAGWPKQAAERYPVGCLELAKFGFFYKGIRDCARCAFCRLEVSGWENGDTAYGEHLRWNRNCSFLMNLNVGNIPLGQVELPQLMDSVVENSSSIGDRVVCFQCGGGLKDWAIDDDPWVEHAAWFPMCAYLLAKKGQNFVNAVQSRVITDRTKEENEKKERERQEFERAEKEKREKAEHEEPNERPVAEVPMVRLCKVCLDRELGIVFLPCGHMSACAECAPQLYVCPICRAKPAAYIRAYMP
ncbi:hypothetical protein B566_EDAN002239 [Ephemera danica]|nr:hypothetical protein B566_EDAN002239 [Ephemera danica]